MRRCHRRTASHEPVENAIAFIGERLQEELDQRARERSGVRSLAALGLGLDHIARPCDAGGLLGTTTRAGPAARRRGIARCVHHHVFGLVASALRPELDFLVAAEVKRRLPSVLQAVGPLARHAVRGVPPAELIDEAPAPLPLVGQHQILHVEAAFAILRMLFDVQEVRAVGSQHRLDVAPRPRRTTPRTPREGWAGTRSMDRMSAARHRAAR